MNRLPSQIDPTLAPTLEVFERPSDERPTAQTFSTIGEWLLGPARQIAHGLHAFDELAWRLLATGLPIMRVSLHVAVVHPQFFGTNVVWWRSTGQTTQTMITHELVELMQGEDTPVKRVVLFGETVRRRLEVPDAELDFPILVELKTKGATDFLALPITSAHGAYHYMISFAIDRPGGLSEGDVVDLTWISRLMPLVIDMHSHRAIARNLLAFYLGATTGPRVLAGQIRRGMGEVLNAVLWSSDLRGFTERSDRLPGERMIAILNALFDAQANAINQHGGEILKFIGDGLLAIFPIADPGQAADAARRALEAAVEAQAAVERLREHAALAGEASLKIVVALHTGSVLYGNIGAANRLDFTVIGPAVNLVSRVEAVAKALDQPIVVTDDFVRAFGEPMRSLGRHQLRGLALAHELFAPEGGRQPPPFKTGSAVG
ncbi:MAG TPA: adenylate/guanylate cyclase domain-containing protein [Xanthobacteraceae bacterium]|nr:adenylate/guanylate cyclase domain-containing protein [Xanthobacteraceae bacterium]